jgi:hypothetical protein
VPETERKVMDLFQENACMKSSQLASEAALMHLFEIVRQKSDRSGGIFSLSFLWALKGDKKERFL